MTRRELLRTPIVALAGIPLIGGWFKPANDIEVVLYPGWFPDYRPTGPPRCVLIVDNWVGYSFIKDWYKAFPKSEAICLPIIEYNPDQHYVTVKVNERIAGEVTKRAGKFLQP